MPLPNAVHYICTNCNGRFAIALSLLWSNPCWIGFCIPCQHVEASRVKTLSLRTLPMILSSRMLTCCRCAIRILLVLQVLVMSASKGMAGERMKWVGKFWAEGIGAQVYNQKDNPFMQEQMSYAATQGLRFGVVLRQDDLENEVRLFIMHRKHWQSSDIVTWTRSCGFFFKSHYGWGQSHYDWELLEAFLERSQSEIFPDGSQNH